MKLNLGTQRILTIIAAMSGLATLSFNCAPNMFMSAKYLNDDSSLSGQFDKPNSPYVLFTSYQQFQSMLNVTGQGSAMTGAQKAEFDLRTGALSGTDNVTSVNAPLMIGATSLAGEVCNGLIARENAQSVIDRAFFPFVDFTRPLSGNTPDAYVQSAQKMAQAFYGRPLNGEEQQILTGYYSEFMGGLPADTADQTTNLYLTLCAAMLSSFDSMTY